MGTARVLLISKSPQPTLAQQVLRSVLTRRQIPCRLYNGALHAYSTSRSVGLLKAMDEFCPTVIGESIAVHDIQNYRALNRQLRRLYPDEISIAVGGITTSVDVAGVVKVCEADFGVAGAGEVVFPQALEIIGDTTIMSDLPASARVKLARQDGLFMVLDAARGLTLGDPAKMARAVASPVAYYDLELLGQSVEQRRKYPGDGILKLALDKGCYGRCTFCTPNASGGRVVTSPADLLSFYLGMGRVIRQGKWPYEFVDVHLHDTDLTQSVKRNRLFFDLITNGQRAEFERARQSFRVGAVFVSPATFRRNQKFNIDFLRALGVEVLAVGVDGLVPRTYQKFRKKGTLAPIESTIDAMINTGFSVQMHGILADQGSTVDELNASAALVLRMADCYDPSRFKVSLATSVIPHFGTDLFDDTGAYVHWLTTGHGSYDHDPVFPLVWGERPVDEAAQIWLGRYEAEKSSLEQKSSDDAFSAESRATVEALKYAMNES